MARKLDQLLPPVDQERIVEAIRQAESTTSGEIKVHIEDRCPGGDPYRRATALFSQLGLQRTREHNAVLIYVAMGPRKLALLGDRGIHQEVGAPFWTEAVERMRTAFARGAFGEGIVGAVQAVGSRLAQRFPPRPDDKNELPDDISTAPT